MASIVMTNGSSLLSFDNKVFQSAEKSFFIFADDDTHLRATSSIATVFFIFCDAEK
jgi:hypothetical protein